MSPTRLQARLAILVAAASAALAGCDAYHYHAGRYFDVRHRAFHAIDHYEKFLKDRPEDPRAAEVHVRAGELYESMQRCVEAHHHFETAAREFPQAEPWAARARAGIMDCPDYFPLRKGLAWVYGDSASRGRNMRLDAEVRQSSGAAAGTILGALYAGSKQIRVDRARYEKRDWMVYRVDDGERVPILRYPFRKGQTWKAQSGKTRLVYRIEADDARVKTVAGTFTGCLKVRELDKRLPGSWKYDYYAPFVGRVATTVGGPGFENPNTELIKFAER